MTPKAKRSSQPNVPGQAFVRPYPASWFDRMTDWVDRLPIPWWLFYVLLALPINGAVAIVLWQTGIYAAVGFHPMQVFMPSLPIYFLALTHGLDHVAASAMTRFRPSFRGDDGAFAAAVYRMTTLPARTALVFPVVAGLVSVPFGQIEMASLQMGGLDHVPALFISVLAYFYMVAYLFFYHTWHQLREIHRLHRDHAEVRLGRVGPLYALSRVTSLTALGLVLNNYGWFVAQPGGNPNNTVTLLEGGTNLLIALIVFVWPLWGAHRLLTEAKEKGLSDVALRKEGARAQLHDAVDKGQLAKVDPLHKALDALNSESIELGKVATWPWAPGTLRNLVGAVLLPMVLWLIQFGLGRLLG